MSNNRPPAGMPVEQVSAGTDMREFDRLPQPLRTMLCEAPFDVSAKSVREVFRSHLRHHDSRAMAICATAGDFSRLIEDAL